MKRLCLALIGLVALSGAAAAADLPAAAPAPYYKAPTFIPVYSWTGFYLGVNGGGGFGTSSWPAVAGFNVSGGQFGGTAGYNYQFGQGVLGVEGDLDWSGISGNSNTSCPAGCSTSNDWMATVRGRFGYAIDRFMPYVTGGAAFGNIKASTPGFSASNTNAGWTVGLGLEFGLTGNWTAKAEYLYVDLGRANNVSFNANLIRVGANYRF